MHYRFGDFTFDSGGMTLTGPAGGIALRPMTLKLLHALLEAAPDVVATDELLDRVWGRQAVAPGVVAQSIAELRRALADSAQSPTYIETRHRIGYRFCGDVRVEESGPRGGSVAERSNPAIVTAPARRRSKVIGSALVVAAALLGSMVFLRGPGVAEQPGSDFPVDVQLSGTPKDREAQQWFRQALHALRDRQLDRAAELLERTLSREPTSPAVLATLASVRAEVGEMHKAQALSRDALDAAEGLPRSELLRLQGLDAALNARWADALDRFAAVFALEPGDANAGQSLLRAQLAIGRTEDAERTLDALEDLPEALFSPVQRSLARARLAGLRGLSVERGQHAQAALQSSSEPRSRLEARLELAAALLASGEREGALRELETIGRELNESSWPAGALRWQMLQGQWHREAGQLDLAISHYGMAEKQADTLGDMRSADAARREAAYAQVLTGAMEQAMDSLDEVLSRQIGRGDRREAAATENVRSVGLQRLGNMDEAAQSGERALTLYRETGDRSGESAARNNLGMLLARAGRNDEALQQLQEARLAFDATGNRRGAAVALSNIAALHGRSGRAQAAREANEAALAEFTAVGADLDAARLRFNLALQDRRAGQLDNAEQGLRAALSGFEAAHAGTFRWVATASLADILLRKAQLDQAEQLLRPALEDGVGAPEQAASLRSAAGQLAMLRGDFNAARQQFQLARDLRKSVELKAWVRMSELDLAEVDAREGRLSEAAQRLRVIRREMLADRELVDAATAGSLLAAVLLAQGQGDASRQLVDELEPVAASDAGLALRTDLLRAAVNHADAATYNTIATRARGMGFERMALMAELLAGGEAADRAEAAMADRGIDLRSAKLVW